MAGPMSSEPKTMSFLSFPKIRHMTRRVDTSKVESIGKMFGDHVRQADVGTRAATLDVAVPFIHAMKKSHHDFMLRCKLEMSMSADQRMSVEMLPMPKLKGTISASFLLKNKELTATMYQSLLKLKEFTRSNDALLYIVSFEKQELILCPNFIHSPTHRVNIKIEPGKTLAPYVAFSGEYVMTKDVLKDSRFPLGLGYLGICNEAAMGVPVQTPSGQVIAVMELSKRASRGYYQQKDELAAVCLAKWMGNSVGMTTDIQLFVDRHQFFNYIKHILIYYSSAGDFPFETVLTHLMTFSEQYLRAYKGRLYVLIRVEEDGKYRYRLDLFAKPEGGNLFVKTNTEHLGVKNTVAQTVMREKRGLNLLGCQVTEYESWFYDDNIHSTICQPISGKAYKSIGAIEFFNKCDGIMFSEEDEKTLAYISKYLSIMLQYYKLTVSKRKLKAKLGLYTEMMAHHIFPSESVMEKMKDGINIPDDLFTFSFFPKKWSIEYLSKLCVVLMDKTLGNCHFPDLDLSNFLITLAKAHDPEPPFTNFLHTFTVFHCVAVMILNHRGFFTKCQQEYILLAALFHGLGVRKLSTKYSKGFHMASFSAHYVNQFFKIFKFSDKIRCFWINMLTKACSERNHKRFHNGICKFLVKDTFNWDNEIHKFHAMALVMRVAEDAMWYKPFQFTAYMSKNLLTQMRQEQNELEIKMKKLSKMRQSKQRIRMAQHLTGREFVAKQINDLRTKCLPNIEVLGYLLPDVLPLCSLACRTVRQWELISRGTDCWIWEVETSWPKLTTDERNFYFSPIDFFIKELSQGDDQTCEDICVIPTVFQTCYRNVDSDTTVE